MEKTETEQNIWKPPVRSTSAMAIYKDHVYLYGGIGVSSIDAMNKINSYDLSK